MAEGPEPSQSSKMPEMNDLGSTGALRVVIRDNGDIVSLDPYLLENLGLETTPENISSIFPLRRDLNPAILNWYSDNNDSVRLTLLDEGGSPFTVSVINDEEGLYSLFLEREKREIDKFFEFADLLPTGIVLLDPYIPEGQSLEDFEPKSEQQLKWPIAACNRAYLEMNKYINPEDEFSPTNNRLIGESVDTINVHFDSHQQPMAREQIIEHRRGYLRRIQEEKKITIEGIHRGGDNNLIYISINTGMIRLDGKYYIVGIDTDVTENIKLTELLRAFAHSAAHDMKNPLSRIQGYLYLLIESIASNNTEEIEICIQSITAATEDMSDTILAHIALAEPHTTDAERENLSINQVLSSIKKQYFKTTDAVDLQTPRAGRETFQTTIYDKTVIFDFPDTQLLENDEYIFGDRKWLVRCIENYLLNAVKYGGNPQAEVAVNIIKLDEWIRIEVTDNGDGIKPEDIDKLFVPFSRLERSKQGGRREGSHGLGLSIVKSMIEAQGGKVGIESKVGEGSTFYFILPEGNLA